MTTINFSNKKYYLYIKIKTKQENIVLENINFLQYNDKIIIKINNKSITKIKKYQHNIKIKNCILTKNTMFNDLNKIVEMENCVII